MSCNSCLYRVISIVNIVKKRHCHVGIVTLTPAVGHRLAELMFIVIVDPAILYFAFPRIGECSSMWVACGIFVCL